MKIVNKDLPEVIEALRAANVALGCCFVWEASPEGHDYWEGQADHLLNLAKQIEDNPRGYDD
jgi:hypothetical protein